MARVPPLARPDGRRAVTVTAAEPAARRIRVTGVVQGVGFRPFVHRLAVRHGLGGWVRNAGGEVEIAVGGSEEALAAFIGAITREAPPLARIDALEVEPSPEVPAGDFVIEPSRESAGTREPVSPDVAPCAACERELFDPADRRYRYPFITCTDCGPRFTVIEAMPYDRVRTSMHAFVPCAACEAEYATPADRRFHSETNSCPACGPRLWLEAPDGEVSGREDALAAAAAVLRAGGILALRGLGGFHLAADARSDAAVARLRARKRRDAKPLAVMVRTAADAARLVELTAESAALLESPVHPIVILPERSGCPLSRLVAPGIGSVGVMLPSTPLHHLLLDLVRAPLVMTSGNVSDEPIATGNAEARQRLGAIADAFLLHDREIVSRYDDSVIRPVRGRRIVLRRARGLAPLPLRLPVASPEHLVAVGADLKNTFTLVDGTRAYVSQHVGDLDSLETVTHFHEALARFEALFRIAPAAAVHDLHPGYFSTRLARELSLPWTIAVQHHHAHIAAVLAEHGKTDPVVGLAFDGTGYGDDGHVWGAEVLLADLRGYRRLARLRYAPMPGGDLAAREPWRAALGFGSLEPGLAPAFDAALAAVPARELAAARLQLARRLNAPLASSLGRLFDAAAALLGVHTGRQYEGQAAMKLEALAGTRPGTAVELPIDDAGDVWVIDPLPLLAGLAGRRTAGADPADLAADFHASIVALAVRIAAASAERCGVRTVALGGGSFQNARLAVEIPARLEALGLRVLQPRELGPNDGAVSYGQAAVASARLAGAGSTLPN
ncbi:MAG TPA: carbamoyltransferase HypF [Gemmatimonadales bacterium]